MTRLLSSLVLMAIAVFGINWIIETFLPSIPDNYALPISVLLGITIGFFIYIQIDNRIG
ncbi:hypothetical protein LNK15_03995 [Jeotgalicoccus huakuii]|uniref:hypothetical protein n=1 Tax=Jeotgalicoccus TaxID=227979 RepID=UPI000410EF65|nr:MULTISPECIES: hypothetical protein [Jeotgalicoccus]MCK1976213.1 hypothetical protein [Jeotgalicoccus huakuii]QQD84969.1 hypothetical protein JEM45_10285 [Jeotgalicoccus sp. ATCC 8456]